MADPRCVLCASAPLLTDPERQTRVCSECARTTGVQVMPPSRRPLQPCARCEHAELVRVVPRELTATPGESGVAVAAPMMLTYAVQSQTRLFFRGNSVESPAAGAGHGVLEAYVCRACGFIEWYCQAPEDLPIGSAFNSELVRVDRN